MPGKHDGGSLSFSSDFPGFAYGYGRSLSIFTVGGKLALFGIHSDAAMQCRDEFELSRGESQPLVSGTSNHSEYAG